MNSKSLSTALLTFFSLWAAPTLAFPNATASAREKAGPPSLSPQEEQAISQAIQDYAQGFIQEDLGLLLGLWDGSSNDLAYVPVESDEPLLSLASLNAYYQGQMAAITIRSGDVSNLRIFPQGPDAASVYCTYHWTYTLKTGGPVLEQPTRASFLLRKRNGRWLYQHFHESVRFAP